MQKNVLFYCENIEIINIKVYTIMYNLTNFENFRLLFEEFSKGIGMTVLT